MNIYVQVLNIMIIYTIFHDHIISACIQAATDIPKKLVSHPIFEDWTYMSNNLKELHYFVIIYVYKYLGSRYGFFASLN